MFKLRTQKEQFAEERARNEALNARVNEQQILIDELSAAAVELAGVIAGEE